MHPLRLLAIALLAAVAPAATAPAQARIHTQMFCWTPDAEFPVGCDEDEEDDDDDGQARRTTPDIGGGQRTGPQG